MKKLDTDKILSSLQENGSVAEKLSSFELRESQLDLLSLIVRAFNEDSILMAEAGTGVGKSFAYLLPAMYFVLSNKEKVVISTATITLQQQLFEKDIPLVASSIEGGSKIKSVIIKGRGNYLCLRRLEEVLKEPPLNDFEYDDVLQISKWAEKTSTGVKSELPSNPADAVWSAICSEADMCPGSYCSFRERCFLTSIRREAASAQIIVVNHHLLFADLAARHEGAGYENFVVLPPFNRLIIDEAHTIENAATSFFSAEFGRTGINRSLGKIFNKRRSIQRGLIVRLCALLPPEEDPIDDVSKAIEKIRSSAEKLDECALEICGNQGILRISPAVSEKELKLALFPCLKKLKKDILSLSNIVRDCIEKLNEDVLNEPVVWEIKSVIKRLESIAEVCSVFCDYKKHEGQVLWIERQQYTGNSWAVFTSAPLELAVKLKESIFSPCKTAVCVSATLAINSDFSFWMERCGINLVESRPLLAGCFPSPFPYLRSVLLAAPTDAPLPDTSGWQEFINTAAGQLPSIAGGSALVLFTSYQSLKSAHSAAKTELEPMGIRCLKQGDDDRTRLLQDFLSDKSSCLFATDSFWEGVDAPGDTLRLVIICRLPFRPPGDPIFEARSESILKRGGNPFLELSLPHAVMKFKQGFGRLMRRSADYGTVVVLDGRLLKKNYGRLFLEALPETQTSFKSLENILKDMERFLF